MAHDTQPDKLLTVDEVAEQLRVNPMTLYRGFKDGTLGIEYIRVGRRSIRVRQSALNEYLKQQTNSR